MGIGVFLWGGCSEAEAPTALGAIEASPTATLLAAAAADLDRYTASKIAFAPESKPSGNLVPGADDFNFGPYPIGFAFQFFGVEYTEFRISTNGFVFFGPPEPTNTSAGCCNGQPIPVKDRVNNMIAAAWVDLNPRPAQISWEVRGEPGFRRLVVDYHDVPLHTFTQYRVTTQIILYEGSNWIEIHTTSLDVGTSGRRYTQGVENAAGTSAAFAVGRIAATVPLLEDGIRFTPGGNSPPEVAVAGPASVDEGSVATLSVSASDPDGDELRYSVTYGDGSSDAGPVVSSAFTLSHTYADDGPYTVTVTITDARDASTTADAELTVLNLAPVVAVTPADTTIIVGESLVASGSFADPGGDEWNATVDYRDGTGPQALAISDKTFQLARTYTAAGTYDVTVAVEDDDGGAGTARVVVRVQTLAQAAEALADAIANLQEGGELSAGSVSALIAKLEAAAARFTDANPTAGVNELEAFKNQVNAMVASGRLSAAHGAELIAAADRIIAGHTAGS